MSFETERKNKEIFLCLSITGFLLYSNSLLCGFVFDDASAIKDNKDIRPNVPLTQLFKNDFWGIPMFKEQSHKSYRPLTVLSFRINYMIQELEPFGYHFINVFLHIVVSILFFIASSHYVDRTVSFIASFMFTVHPVHTEAVTGVVGRAELLSSVFFLLAFISYQKSSMQFNKFHKEYLLMTCCMSSLAMLSKEQGLTVLGMCIVHELVFVLEIHLFVFRSISSIKQVSNSLPSCIFALRRHMFRLSFLVATLGALLMFRIQILQGSSLPVFTKFDNPASLATGLSRYLTYSYLPCLNLWLLLCPSVLCCDWTMASVPLVSSLSDMRILFVIICFVVAIHLVCSVIISAENHATKSIILSVSWMVIPFLPAFNLFFPVGFVIAERVLYIPSMGFCLLVSLGLQRLYNFCQCKYSSQTLNTAISYIFYTMVLAHSLKTFTRNFDWLDERSIFISGLQVNKNNAKLYNNVGHALESKKNYEDALMLFKQVITISTLHQINLKLGQLTL